MSYIFTNPPELEGVEFETIQMTTGRNEKAERASVALAEMMADNYRRNAECIEKNVSKCLGQKESSRSSSAIMSPNGMWKEEADSLTSAAKEDTRFARNAERCSTACSSKHLKDHTEGIIMEENKQFIADIRAKTETERDAYLKVAWAFGRSTNVMPPASDGDWWRIIIHQSGN